MKLARKFVVAILLISFGAVPKSTAFELELEGGLEVLNIVKNVVVFIAKAWNVVDESVDYANVPIPIIEKKESRLFNKIGNIIIKLDRQAENVEAVGTSMIVSTLQSLPQRIRLELRLNDLLDYLTRMEVIYRHFQNYLNKENNFERLTLEDFAKYAVSHDSSSVNSLVERIHAFISSNKRGGVLNTSLLVLLRLALQLLPIDLEYGVNQLENVWSLQLAYADLRGVFALYETFRRFQKQQTAPGRIPSPKQAWVDLADAILYDSKNNVEGALKRINDIVIKDMFSAVIKEVENNMLCEAKQSNQQILYNLYNTIALTELKGYSMIQFSYMLLRLYGQGNFTTESQLIRNRYEERTNNAVEIVKGAMRNVSRDLWMCDPKKHVLGETYEEITQLLQGYVQNEVDLNPDQTCRENCAEYTYTKSHGCFKNLYCRQQRRCNGKIINCQFFDSDMWICPADPLSGRRYEYIEYENGRVLGRKQGGCNRGTSKVDSWWRWLFWHCSYCFCLCDEQGRNSDRYFNMRPKIADIADNMVVTGLRFVKKNRIMHLQIQQGKLLPRGNIDPNTVEWLPIEDYQITDKDIFNGIDYHTLSWEKRAMDLDDLEADEGYLLTGVRFKEIGSHLNFEIYITKFDFDQGKLAVESSLWKDNPNTDASIQNPRTKVKLDHPDIPTLSPFPSIPDSKSDQYIEFTHTDLDRDAAQTTVPFLDAQEVTSRYTVPLSGAGIIHKGRYSFGGFIAPKIITYDFQNHLKAVFSTELVN